MYLVDTFSNRSTYADSANILSGGYSNVSDYARLIRYYDVDGTTLLATLSNGSTSSDVVDASFELLRSGGCGQGSLTLSKAFNARTLEVGKYIAFDYKDGERWYFSRIESIDYSSPAGVTVSLYGLWSLLQSVVCGGSGEAYADYMLTDRPPHLLANSDYYVNDPDWSGQSWDTCSNYEEVLSVLYNTYVYPKYPIVLQGPTDNPDPSNLWNFPSFVFRGSDSVTEVWRSIAIMLKNASFGVDQNRKLFATTIPEYTALEFQEGVAGVRNLKYSEDRSLCYTRLVLRGSYIYGLENLTGFAQYVARITNDGGVSDYGDKIADVVVPWIRNDWQAVDFARSFFDQYARPTRRVTFTTGAQGVLIQPWMGRCRVKDRDGNLLLEDIISSVKCSFNAVPTFDVTVGVEDLMIPTLPTPQPFIVEAWGDEGDNNNNGQPQRNPPPLLTNGPVQPLTTGGGAACDAQNAKFVITLFGPPTGGTWQITWVLPDGTDTFTSLNYDTTAATLEGLLEAGTNVGSGNVTVTGGPADEANFIVEFVGDLAQTPINTPTINYNGLTGTSVGGLAYPIQIGRAP